jgi:hypothetical protein
VIAPMTAETRRFGASLAFDADRLVVGAPATVVDGKDRAGVVELWSRSDGGWSFEEALTAEEPEPSDGFGDAVAMAGDWLAVAGPRPAALAREGFVELFRQDAEGWARAERLTAPDGAAQPGDAFGTSVVLSDPWLVVGAPGAFHDGERTGVAYVFRREEDAWSLTQTLSPPSEVPRGASYGFQVAFGGGTLAVAAPTARARDVSAGAVFLYRFIDPPEPELADGGSRDGAAPADGSVADAGMGTTDDGGADAGMEAPEGPRWTLLSTLEPDEPAADLRFGEALAVSGRRVLVGSPGRAPSGAASLYSVGCESDVECFDGDPCTTDWCEASTLECRSEPVEVCTVDAGAEPEPGDPEPGDASMQDGGVPSGPTNPKAGCTVGRAPAAGGMLGGAVALLGVALLGVALGRSTRRRARREGSKPGEGRQEPRSTD